MKLLKKFQLGYLNNFESILYLTIFSIFFIPIKLYVPLFAINIVFVLMLILTGELKLSLSKWQIAVILFIAWSVINTGLSIFIFKTDISIGSLIKLILNMTFLITISMVLNDKRVNINKERLVNFLDFIIIINFIQIVLIYILGGLVEMLFSNALMQSSDSAYAVSSYYNVIGAANKNIWAAKFTFLYVIYIYLSSSEDINLNKKRKLIHIIIGLITTFLLLSRTAQVAIILPILFVAFYSIRNINIKYKIAIYSIFGMLILFFGFILFDKFFHIKFDMTDGGYTRLYIWGEAIKNIWKSHWITGNGIGYSGYFIKTVIDRTESNLHNVYLNIFFEMGLIGITAYISFLIFYFKEIINRNNMIKVMFTLVIPFVVITMLQYLGFDNDIAMLFILILVCNKCIK